MVFTGFIQIDTRGNTDVIDITSECGRILGTSGLKNGVMTVFNPGSTGSVTTIEYDPNLVKDLKCALDTMIPQGNPYDHGKTWGDDNAASHIRATLMGPSISIPFADGALTLGTWQQIAFCDFDTRPRERKIIVQVMGE